MQLTHTDILLERTRMKIEGLQALFNTLTGVPIDPEIFESLDEDTQEAIRRTRRVAL